MAEMLEEVTEEPLAEDEESEERTPSAEADEYGCTVEGGLVRL